MNPMLERAREIQAKRDRSLAELQAEASTEDGRVKARMNGHRALLEMRLDPELMKGSPEELEQLVLETVGDVIGQIEEKLIAKEGKVEWMPRFSKLLSPDGA